MGTHDTHLVDENDDDEDVEDEDVYMYPTDMHPDERDAYRSAVRASKSSEWEHEQHENIVGSKHKTGKSSRSTGIPTTMRKSQRMGIEPQSPYEIKNKYLEMEYKEMEAYVNQQREKWKTYECTIINESIVVETLLTRSYKISIWRGVGSDGTISSVHDVFAKFDPTTKSLGQFGNELVLFRDAKKGFGDRAAIATRSTMVPENDRVVEKDYPDLLDISAKVGEEEDNQLFQWVRPIHLDDEVGNPNPRIAAHAQEFGVNVERVLSEEVHSEIFSKDTNDLVQAALNSHQEIDSTSAGHSSRPSAVGTSASGYNGSRGGTNDGGDNAGGDIYEHQHSQYLISQFTYENDFTHCTQDEDHGSRRAGPSIGAIGKPYRGRDRTMEPYNEELLSGSFEFMSIGTQFSDSSNEANVYPPHVMSYSQPSSSTDEEYGMSRCSLSRQMPYQVPYQMEGGFDINTWVNFQYPIHVAAWAGLKRYMHGMLEFLTNIIEVH
ncbi:hypothetical protein CK203_040495 [Vitis vinifera]|uniref:Uncharacterized protein n=1 Tax=Vitis vinifera TaxID=29760 RepID=A0A438I851_VITVI|nr:hypothetical protein CK203_040495 [Vitis vinifera]